MNTNARKHGTNDVLEEPYALAKRSLSKVLELLLAKAYGPFCILVVLAILKCIFLISMK